MEAVRILKEQFDHEDTAYKKAFQEQQYAENQYFSSHIENLPLLFMKPAIEFSIKIVDDLRKKGELPYGAKKIFTNDLLQLGQCICGTNLQSQMKNGDETNQSRLQVLKVRDDMAKDQGLDSSVELKFYFEEKMLGNINKFTNESFDNSARNLSTARQKTQQHNTSIRDIKNKLLNLGNVDVEQIVKDHEHLVNKIGETTSEIKDIAYQLKQNEEKNKEYRAERKKLMSKDSKAKQIGHEQDVWESALNVFQKSYSELKQEIRNDVQKKTLEIFLKTMYKKNKFKNFKIGRAHV